MIDKKFFDELSAQITRLMPTANAFGNDVKKNISQILQSSFQKMDLVTREEFEAQSAVLQRATAKLEVLEAAIVILEQKISAKPAPESDETPVSPPGQTGRDGPLHDS